MNNEIRTTNYQLNTSDERQATCDEFALFWSFFANFCALYASLRLKRTVFTRQKNTFSGKKASVLNIYILVIRICFGFRYSDYVFKCAV